MVGVSHVRLVELVDGKEIIGVSLNFLVESVDSDAVVGGLHGRLVRSVDCKEVVKRCGCPAGSFDTKMVVEVSHGRSVDSEAVGVSQGCPVDIGSVVGVSHDCSVDGEVAAEVSHGRSVESKGVAELPTPSAAMVVFL